MGSDKKMTEQEMSCREAQLRTGLAFGGHEMSDEMRSCLRSVWQGECTHDELRERIIRKYTGR